MDNKQQGEHTEQTSEKQVKDNEQTPNGLNEEKETEAQEKPDLIIDIRQFQTFLQILDSKKSTAKVIIALLVLTIAIFTSLAFVTIAIKSFYPYNEIKTNMFGATTMKNEDIELTYWLFNTSELWANSGIKVKKGDILTIRASGKSNTSIHHLVNSAAHNMTPRYKWVGTEGEVRPEQTRTEFRIYPERNPDALIMQVIPEEIDLAHIKIKEDSTKDHYFHPKYNGLQNENDIKKNYERFYYIGKERIDLHIAQDGILHFAVNDIVLTPKCIDAIRNKNNAKISDKISGKDLKKYTETINKIKKLDSKKDTAQIKNLYSSIRQIHAKWNEANANALYLGPHPKPLIQDDSLENAVFPSYNELDFYETEKYYNAWYDDNVGSFLIVVEKRKNQ